MKHADDALEKALTAKIAVGNAKAVEALIRLVEWVPTQGFPANWPLSYGAHYSEKEEAAERERLNDDCAFATKPTPTSSSERKRAEPTLLSLENSRDR